MKKIILLCISIFYINANEYIYKEISKNDVIKDENIEDNSSKSINLIPIRRKGQLYKETLIDKTLKNGDRVVSTSSYVTACMLATCPVDRRFEIYDKSEKLKISKKFGDKRVIAIEEIDGGGYRLYLDDDKLNRYLDYNTYYYQIDVDKNMTQINIDFKRDRFFKSFIDDSYEEFVKKFTPINYKKALYNHHNLLYYIVQSDDIRKIKFLEKHSYKIDKKSLESTLKSCMQSKKSKYNIDVLNYLETKGLSILTEEFLLHLIDGNQNEILRYMVEKRGVEIKNSALIHTIVNKNREAFDYLLSKMQNIDLNCSATVLQKDINKKLRSVSSMILSPEYEMDYYLKNVDLFDAHLNIKKVDGKYEVFVVENKSKKEHKYNFSKDINKIIKKYRGLSSTIGIRIDNESK